MLITWWHPPCLGLCRLSRRRRLRHRADVNSASNPDTAASSNATGIGSSPASYRNEADNETVTFASFLPGAAVATQLPYHRVHCVQSSECSPSFTPSTQDLASSEHCTSFTPMRIAPVRDWSTELDVSDLEFDKFDKSQVDLDEEYTDWSESFAGPWSSNVTLLFAGVDSDPLSI